MPLTGEPVQGPPSCSNHTGWIAKFLFLVILVCPFFSFIVFNVKNNEVFRQENVVQVGIHEMCLYLLPSDLES